MAAGFFITVFAGLGAADLAAVFVAAGLAAAGLVAVALVAAAFFAGAAFFAVGLTADADFLATGAFVAAAGLGAALGGAFSLPEAGAFC